MSKLIFVVLAVLLLSKDLKAEEGSFLNITFVTDAKQYIIDNPDGIWQRFHQTELLYTLGEKEQGIVVGRYQNQFIRMYTPGPDEVFYELDRDVSITYLEALIVTKDSNEAHPIYLIDGGIGKNYASLLVELPIMSDAALVNFLVYGRYL